MKITSYLHLSRHKVYYIRWPIPVRFHPENKQSYIKTSLQTRDKHKAMQLSRILVVLAEQIISHIETNTMNYFEIRRLVKEHFAKYLSQVKETITKEGRLEPHIIESVKREISYAEQGLARGKSMHIDRDDTPDVIEFINQNELEIPTTSKEFNIVREEYVKGFISCYKQIIQMDTELNSCDLSFNEPAPVINSTSNTQTSTETLREVIDKFIDEHMLGNRWGRKTEEEYKSRLDLLCEILGDNTVMSSIGKKDSQKVKEVLINYPKNRSGNPKTKGLPLETALAVKGVEKLQPQTTNKYLSSYSSLFNWAKRNDYAESNIFEGKSIKVTKTEEEKRHSFPLEHVSLILDKVLNNTHGLISKNKDYQYWGPLLGLYTGARLSELGQLELEDIIQVNNVWCLDITDVMKVEKNKIKKKLKTTNSKRIVPIHSKLIKLGLLDYVEQLKEQGKDRLLHELSWTKTADGYGRNLGRWFNEKLLVKLGIKNKNIVFHSLRHTVITYLLQAGIPEPITKQIVGHAKQGVTQENYNTAGYTLKQLKDALEKLPY